MIEDYVIKSVDIQKQLLLVDRLAELHEVYKAKRASKHLIGSDVHWKYTVILSPCSEQAGSGYLQDTVSSTAPGSHQMCIACPERLHAAQFAHTNIRWPNVIHCSSETFCLIDWGQL